MQRIALKTSTPIDKSDSAPGRPLSPSIQASLASLSTGGLALPDATRSYFEPRFGWDFGKVRVHTDARAAAAADALQARAFTWGRHLAFAEGQFRPESDRGRRLLAHELAHVVQQAHDATPGKIQREATEPGGAPPRCGSPQEITDEVRRFRTEVLRQIARNRLLRDAALPATPELTHEERVERLVGSLEGTRPAPELSLPVNVDRARAALHVLTDEPGFSFASALFFTCEEINLPELQIRAGQQFGGFVDPSRSPIEVYYGRDFAENIESFLDQDDQEALRTVLEYIAHEKRHVTLAGNVPTIGSEALQPSAPADVDQVNYYIEEILTTAEEIAVDARFDSDYEVPGNVLYHLWDYWRVIRQSVAPEEIASLRAGIQRELRTRFGRPDCDNAISTGVLSAMQYESWYHCANGRVIRLPEGVTPCTRADGETHAICGVR